jgi:hypothetical protein
VKELGKEIQLPTGDASHLRRMPYSCAGVSRSLLPYSRSLLPYSRSLLPYLQVLVGLFCHIVGLFCHMCRC